MKLKLLGCSILFCLLFCNIINCIGDVNLKLTDLDSSPINLVWCGSNRDTVLILTEKNSVYRSDDLGFNFKKLNDVLTHTGQKELEEHENEIGKVSRIIESPVDKSLLIFLGTHGINWIGEDCGRKVKALNHGRKIQEYLFHPTERNWGLASAYTLCEDFQNGEPCKIYKELFLTKDLGESWDLLGSYIVQFSWGVFDESHIRAGIPKERILITLELRGKGSQKNTGWSYKVDFLYSDDFFKTKRIGAHKGNKFLLTKNFLYIAQLVDQEAQEVNLLVAKSDEKFYNFHPINTGMNKFREHSYTFLDTTQQTVFLNINHFGETSKYGHIYISGPNGVNFSQSLKFNVRSAEDHSCDFQSIESVEGSYIANIIDYNYMIDAELELEEEERESMESMQNSNKKRTDHSNNAYKDFMQTTITFNKGGNWKRLKAPLRDVDGKKYDCDSCYLNLHGVTGNFPTFYSVESAAGIIIGNGNVGEYLSHDEDDISSFLSRDGGLNWFEVKKGSHIYEIGDHGALIVIADDHNPTDTVYYTWDEGLTWQDLKISDEKIMVKNIIIEPLSTSQHFIIYGESHKKSQKKGVVIGVDFTSLHEPQCKNPEEPDTPNSDYETWSPNDGRAGHECLLGRKVIITRRKRNAECFNGMAFERKIVQKNCECTDEDYECDVGFSRASIYDPCTKIDKSSSTHENDVHTPPENCNGVYTISKGYRKIPGNTCINGVKYDPILIPCPNTFLISLGKLFLYILIITIVLILVVLVFNKNFVNQVNEYVSSRINSSNQAKKSELYVNIVNINLKINYLTFRTVNILREKLYLMIYQKFQKLRLMLKLKQPKKITRKREMIIKICYNLKICDIYNELNLYIYNFDFSIFLKTLC